MITSYMSVRFCQNCDRYFWCERYPINERFVKSHCYNTFKCAPYPHTRSKLIALNDLYSQLYPVLETTYWDEMDVRYWFDHIIFPYRATEDVADSYRLCYKHKNMYSTSCYLCDKKETKCIVPVFYLKGINC